MVFLELGSRNAVPPFAGRTIHTISIHKMSVRTYAHHASHRWVGGLLPLPPARQLLEETISLLVVDVTVAACPAATPGWVGDPGKGSGEKFRGDSDSLSLCLPNGPNHFGSSIGSKVSEPIDFFSRPPTLGALPR